MTTIRFSESKCREQGCDVAVTRVAKYLCGGKKGGGKWGCGKYFCDSHLYDVIGRVPRPALCNQCELKASKILRGKQL